MNLAAAASVMLQQRVRCCSSECDAATLVKPIESWPDLFNRLPSPRFGVNKLESALKDLVDDGLRAVLIFGVPQKTVKVNSPDSIDGCVLPETAGFSFSRMAQVAVLTVTTIQPSWLRGN